MPLSTDGRCIESMGTRTESNPPGSDAYTPAGDSSPATRIAYSFKIGSDARNEQPTGAAET